MFILKVIKDIVQKIIMVCSSTRTTAHQEVHASFVVEQ